MYKEKVAENYILGGVEDVVPLLYMGPLQSKLTLLWPEVQSPLF